MEKKKLPKFKFSFGPWNIHTGADSFGPEVRKKFDFRQKIGFYKKLGFDGVQLHDDDVVKANASYKEIVATAKKIRHILDNENLEAEFIAPRLWEDSKTIDGSITSNNVNDRKYAWDRSKKAVDIANIMGTKKIVLWLAREGTYIRESKDSKISTGRIVDYLNMLLEYDRKILILGEMKPNEPMDHTYCPTTGHFIGLSYKTVDPDRVGVLIESAHCILAGLDPSDEMGYALWHNKLWGVHLNDQNGMKFDEDKTFGSVDLRRAFNQVYLLVKYGYGKNGEYIGLDVKTMRTQKTEDSVRHLKNSKEIFQRLVKIACSIDETKWQKYVSSRNYEELDMFIMDNLLK